MFIHVKIVTLFLYYCVIIYSFRSKIAPLVFFQAHPWVTKHGAEPLPPEDDNCSLIEVTEEEVENSVKHIPSLTTVVSFFINEH